MDGDHSAKTMEAGSNAAQNANEMTEGIHESVKQTPASGSKTTGQGTSVFSKDGAVGSMFNADGALGGTAQKLGGPFDKEGAIGGKFKADGSIGGMVQENLAKKGEEH